MNKSFGGGKDKYRGRKHPQLIARTQKTVFNQWNFNTGCSSIYVLFVFVALSTVFVIALGVFQVVPLVKFILYHWDGQTLCPRTDCFKLEASLHHGVSSIYYHLFAQILALCRARIITNPIRQWPSSCYSAGHCLTGLVDLIARLSDMILAKLIERYKQ
jgi:hypothetical protein